MNPVAQYLLPLVAAALISAVGWVVAYMPEPAPCLYIYLLPTQRKPFIEFYRLAGRMFGALFGGWMVFYSILTVIDLLR